MTLVRIKNRQRFEDFCISELQDYRYSDTVKHDLLVVGRAFAALRVGSGHHATTDGKVIILVKLDGCIPVDFKGLAYNIPVVMRLHRDHPYAAPKCKVDAHDNIYVRPCSRVDKSGRITIPYLSHWRHPESTLLGLIHALQDTFGKDCPVYSLSASMHRQVTEGSNAHLPRTQQRKEPPALPQQQQQQQQQQWEEKEEEEEDASSSDGVFNVSDDNVAVATGTRGMVAAAFACGNDDVATQVPLPNVTASPAEGSDIVVAKAAEKLVVKGSTGEAALDNVHEVYAVPFKPRNHGGNDHRLPSNDQDKLLVHGKTGKAFPHNDAGREMAELRRQRYKGDQQETLSDFLGDTEDDEGLTGDEIDGPTAAPEFASCTIRTLLSSKKVRVGDTVDLEECTVAEQPESERKDWSRSGRSNVRTRNSVRLRDSTGSMYLIWWGSNADIASRMRRGTVISVLHVQLRETQGQRYICLDNTSRIFFTDPYRTTPGSSFSANALSPSEVDCPPAPRRAVLAVSSSATRADARQPNRRATPETVSKTSSSPRPQPRALPRSGQSATITGHPVMVFGETKVRCFRCNTIFLRIRDESGIIQCRKCPTRMRSDAVDALREFTIMLKTSDGVRDSVVVRDQALVTQLVDSFGGYDEDTPSRILLTKRPLRFNVTRPGNIATSLSVGSGRG